MDMILFDNSSLNMLYHVTNNSALPIVLAGNDTRVMEWIVWDDLCKKKNATWNVKYRKIANVMEAKQELRRKKNKTKQMLQPEKADN